MERIDVIRKIADLMATKFADDRESLAPSTANAALVYDQMPATLASMADGMEYDFVSLARLAMHDVCRDARAQVC